VHGLTHIHKQTNTNTHRHTQTQRHTHRRRHTLTHILTQTYTDTHRHTQTHRHKGTETQRHRDTDSFYLSLCLPWAAVLSLSRLPFCLSLVFSFPFSVSLTHTLSPLTAVLRLPIAAYNDELVRSGESTYTTTTCALIVGSPLCGRSLLNAGVWQCTRFSQIFFWWSLTNDPKWSTRSHSTATLQYFGDSPRRGVPGTPYSWNKLKSQRIKSIRHLSGIERVPYVIATCT